MDKALEQKFQKLFDQGKHSKILALIAEIPESEHDQDMIAWHVRSLNNARKYQQAIDLSMKHSDWGEKCPRWNYMLGYAYLHKKRFEDANKAFLKAKKLAGDDEEWIVKIYEISGYLVGEYDGAWLPTAEEINKYKTIKVKNRRANKAPIDPSKTPFADFDFNGFWNTDSYATDNYTGAIPTDEQFTKTEKLLGYKLPESYKALMRRCNGGMPINTHHLTIFEIPWELEYISINGILGVDPQKPYNVIESNLLMKGEWGYPDIGIAICDCPSAGHDMIFLDYRHCGKDGEPEVVHIDQESDYDITYIADNFESFICGLVNADEYEDEDY